MTELSHLPATIRARVHDGAIDRVSRFFNASVADAAAELIQNSRRSGATRLDVATEATEGGTVVTVTDDGFGIADPAVLLSFGESGWDAATAKREDPAGMGVYALSKRGCVISSRPATAGIAPMPGWRVEFTPDCFLGNPATERQAMDRAHRIGQDKPVFVHRLIAENTVEAAIQRMQARKQALADALFEGTGRGPLGLTDEDIDALFGSAQSESATGT